MTYREVEESHRAIVALTHERNAVQAEVARLTAALDAMEARVRQAKAEAWDEGYEAGWYDEARTSDDEAPKGNPYAARAMRIDSDPRP